MKLSCASLIKQIMDMQKCYAPVDLDISEKVGDREVI